jgi:single-strand DNA-binding protein
VIFSDGLANVVETYLQTGSKVYIEGSLKTRKWTDQRNEDRYTTGIVLQPFNGKLIMLDGANNRQANDGRDPSNDATSREANNVGDPGPAGGNGLTNDIPF